MMNEFYSYFHGAGKYVFLSATLVLGAVSPLRADVYETLADRRGSSVISADNVSVEGIISDAGDGTP